MSETDTSSNGIELDVNVDQVSYIPNTEDNLMYKALKDTKVSFVLLLLIVIAIYVGIFFLVGNPNPENPDSPVQKMIILVLEVVLWVMLIVVVYINLKNYDKDNYDFKAKIQNLFNSKMAELDVVAKEKNTQEQTAQEQTANKTKGSNLPNCIDQDSNKEVFHIANNKYTYQEAKDVCEEYDARLATYDEIERAYDKGANWCSYGWSKEQLGLFPTQKSIYNELKKIPGHQHDCGRPGINGGYMANPNVKFGVNCYGVKPKAKANDKSYMHTLNHSPKLSSGMTMEQVREARLSEMIVAPFNNNIWSRRA